MANKKIIRYNKRGEYAESEVCKGAGVDFGHLYSEMPPDEEEGEDLCPACEHNLFYSRQITKRIAILDSEKNVAGWVCPSCFTEFNTKDEVIILMSSSSVQGKA